MSARPAYDTIGVGYTATRRADPRIAQPILRALDGVASVVNVGAGAGAYEPPSTVLAIDPSPVMLEQRPPGLAPAVLGRAEALPLEDASVEAALGVLTIHHWDDVDRGLAELRRVATRRVVLLHWDREVMERFWLYEYFPESVTLHRGRYVPFSRIAAGLGAPLHIEPVPIPWDCTDGFAAAYWRRPEAYLDATVRAGISSLAQLDRAALAAGVARLQEDLASGAWQSRFASLLSLASLDCGYRLVVADL
jgi:SAM-dependent methyltransferase